MRNGARMDIHPRPVVMFRGAFPAGDSYERNGYCTG